MMIHAVGFSAKNRRGKRVQVQHNDSVKRRPQSSVNQVTSKPSLSIDQALIQWVRMLSEGPKRLLAQPRIFPAPEAALGSSILTSPDEGTAPRVVYVESTNPSILAGLGRHFSQRPIEGVQFKYQIMRRRDPKANSLGNGRDNLNG